MKPSIGIAIITHNAAKTLPTCLPPLLSSPLHPKILVVNSSSNDGTVSIAKEMGVETMVIPRNEFNHGATRELARHKLNTEIVVMLTPDAILVDETTLGKLIQPLIDGKASISYARQIPHKNAGFFESFSRQFNYPEKNHIRGITDRKIWGVYTFFCSNSCAAYRNSALDAVGGFPYVLIGEDTFTVAKLLKHGHLIAYAADAIVHHSHSYSLKQEFLRSFDTGLSRKMHAGLIEEFGKDEKRGRRYVATLIRELFDFHPALIPYALLQCACKWFGYRLGKNSFNAPIWLKKLCSQQDFYWKN